MKKTILFTLTFSILILTTINLQSQCKLKQMAATEFFPQDKFLDTVTHKKALVILVNNDDDCIMAGTIYKLKKAGWNIEKWTLQSTDENLNAPFKPWQIIYSDSKQIKISYNSQNNSSSNASYSPKYNCNTGNYSVNMEYELEEQINDFNPSIIFTFNNLIDSENVFLNQILLELFCNDRIRTKLIYQAVYTDHMISQIIDSLMNIKFKNTFMDYSTLMKKEVYSQNTMPHPDVQINIAEFGNAKMSYLRAFNKIEKASIELIIPDFEKYNAKKYFSIFNREFFKIYDKDLRIAQYLDSEKDQFGN